jgi:SAM-dependent methyltransferase
MIENVAYCLNCKKKEFVRFYTYWECQNCGQKYPCIKGIPQLYIEENVGDADKQLRNYLYNGLLGRFYNIIMPFLSLPARPIKISKGLWGGYFLALFLIVYSTWRVFWWIAIDNLHNATWYTGLLILLFIVFIYLLNRHKYLLKLLFLAIPVKISLSIRKYHPPKSFKDVHLDFQKEYQDSNGHIRILDIATGSCNSLFRHGWMNLDADYIGVDLSEQMLLKGADFMTGKSIKIDFAFSDAHELPFETESFDIVTCYGAVNGFTDVSKALSEMARVTKNKGKVLFLDEQLYDAANIFEKLYFDHVLSSHDEIKSCPVNHLPPSAEKVEVFQVYQFYYICTFTKNNALI